MLAAVNVIYHLLANQQCRHYTAARGLQHDDYKTEITERATLGKVSGKDGRR